ncbi:hypothetical protein [Massilia brevitalea]|uniref:hypothetical protein n=1 Tax=Massilia brevitalea TaxID=442526 RepID=UPI0027388E49|nr:hypothetical protein [Massilia brevitalea]
MPSKLPTFPGPLTARGAVLAVLLSNEDQTGSEPLQGRVTLAAIVRTLKRKYHWPIETNSFPANAADGRATWATVYSLPQNVIDKALERGGRDWLRSRKLARRRVARLDNEE